MPTEQILAPSGAGGKSETQDPVREAVEFDNPLLAAPARSRHRPIFRGLVKPLLTIATSQYTLVVLLVVLVAGTVSRQASHVINDKFRTITQALKRF